MHVECQAKLNRAGFFGDVMVRVGDGTISISGMRARKSPAGARSVPAFGLGGLGLAATLAGAAWGPWLVVLSIVFPFLLHMILLSTARFADVRFPAGAATNAGRDDSRLTRWFPWLRAPSLALRHLSERGWLAARVVRFDGPGPAGGNDRVRYFVVARGPKGRRGSSAARWCGVRRESRGVRGRHGRQPGRGGRPERGTFGMPNGQTDTFSLTCDEFLALLDEDPGGNLRTLEFGTSAWTDTSIPEVAAWARRSAGRPRNGRKGPGTCFPGR